MMERLEKETGHVFKDKDLLLTALTHSSYANERQTESYERLEFLGDSILGFVTADYLYRHSPQISEGRMTRLRAELVCEESLYAVAQELGLGAAMRLGKGEEATGGRCRQSILADMVEAIIAAIYLDSDLEEARRFIRERILVRASLDEEHRLSDYKTELQELVQRQSDSHISYVLTGESGPDHNKQFFFTVYVNGEAMGEGSGRSKKEAEQMAAKKGLEALGS